ncbi:MAG: dihydrolipoyl dehydrogenase, partial [Chloroflexi bacterium RBG_13_57_8]
MKHYDVIVIGSGCGMNIVEETLSHSRKVALVDKGPLGGTCPNLGCIPSKMLIFPADRVMEIKEAQKLGVTVEVKNIDFNFIMERMRKSVSKQQEEMRRALTHAPRLDFYETEARFIADFTLEAGGEKIKGETIFIAAGSRPVIPPVKGLDSVPYLTSDTVLQLRERPESLIIIGGGYIAVEYGHFFTAMGARVTILEMADRLVLAEEPEIADLLRRELAKRLDIYTGISVEEIKKNGETVTAVISGPKAGKKKEISARYVLAATGRRSNADLLQVEKTGVAVDGKGFIIVDEYLETSRKKIFAVGDVNGRHMFTHTANQESVVAANNALHPTRLKMDYSAAPHAVYSHPQIASVGMTEAEARKKHKILVGRAKYTDVAAGEAMLEENGFTKVIVEKDTGRILGF